MIFQKLDRWVIHGNCLVGYLYDSSSYNNGTRVQTEAIRFVNLSNSEAECLDGKYKLGEPGTYEEHTKELFGKKPEGKLPDLKNTIFLNPNG